MNVKHGVIASKQKGILILDFGAQYTQLIGRCIRNLGVYCEIYPWDWNPTNKFMDVRYKGIILSGGPDSTYEDDSPKAPQYVFKSDIPVLGICYGMQTMVDQLGGKVKCASHREYGYAIVNTLKECQLTGPKNEQLRVWMSHRDRVSQLPDGFTVVGKTKNCPFAVISHENKKLYGVQFHPEVTHTTAGKDILYQFINSICGCRSYWVPINNMINDQILSIRKKVENDQVVLALSGGVDSAVVAVLIQRAIGDQLTCIFVDTGLLRVNEGEQVMETFCDNLGLHVLRVNAEAEFFLKLRGIKNPEKKREIIGNLFIEIFEKESRKIGRVKWLAQGTIYSDVIESFGGKSGKGQIIKSHHNVSGLSDDMSLSLLEPLRDLFKDEVRKIAIKLKLPENIIHRHPFPGPGLGIRIIGEVRRKYADLLRQADAIFLEELHANDLYDKIDQAFAVFLPIKSVGVMGDNRVYEYVIALRAVHTVDFMTADWKQIPYEVLSTISNRIVNEVNGISRVTYDISGKPPSTIEWE